MKKGVSENVSKVSTLSALSALSWNTDTPLTTQMVEVELSQKCQCCQSVFQESGPKFSKN